MRSDSLPVDYKRLVGDDRIHASLCSDPGIFADEMERIFHRGWVFVGHESEIPRQGDFVTRTIGTQPLTDETTNRGLCKHYRAVMTDA
jgi:hypothetical protein